jgi:HD superfamily phosphohydrolase
MKKVILLLWSFLLGAPTLQCDTTVHTAWGKNYVISHPLLEALIKAKVMKRLEGVDQSGPLIYFNKAPEFSRFEHSVGVLVLLQKAGASLKEQVAGLLHDASHTAFSHVADHLLYESNKEESYQDIVHLDFLSRMNVEELVSSYDISLKDLDPEGYGALEQPLPDMCADRIQYVVHTGVVFGKISKGDAQAIIDDLNFENGKWYFTSKELAHKFAALSLHFTKELWGSPWNFVFYEYFTEILKRAIKIQIISLDDIKFGQDQDIITALRNTQDPFIVEGLKRLQDICNFFDVTEFKKGELNTKPKFRGIDPLVKVGDQLMPLSKIDAEYKKKFQEVKKWCERGFGVKMLVKYKSA